MFRDIAAAFACAVALSACGGAAETVARAPTPTSAPAVTSTTSPTPTTAPTEARSLVAEATGPAIDIFDDADTAVPARSLDRADETSGRVVFLATGNQTDERIEVFLPVRPNGSTGWVDRGAVSLTSHGFKVEVRLAAHQLVVTDGDSVVLDTSIGVGTTDTPTPGGVFFIKELLQPPSPDGVYGTYAYGLSGFSTVLETFNGGNGVIGIHGTNDPSSLGSDVSHGCIRVLNDDIERLVEDVGLPLGTPVAIVA